MAAKSRRRADILRVAAVVPCDPKTAHKRLNLGEDIRGGLGIRIDEVAQQLGVSSVAQEAEK